ncbi:MAG TPA: aminopeptidase P N-terminal domain-containing protein [Gemmatimonadaceae bacterium]
MQRHLCFILTALCLVAPIGATSAQISSSEFVARRDSLATHIDSGVVIAFGGRTPVTDFGPFYQLPAFHYLTNFDEADAAFVMVVHGGHATSTVFISPIDPRTAFYYGRRPDSATVVRTLGMSARSFAALEGVVDSLATTGLPIYTLADFADADFARQDSLTRGRMFMRSLAARHPGLVVRDAHPIVDELRARKSPAEIALLKRAAEISSVGHRALLSMPEPQHEYEMQAVLEYNFTRLGGARPAYGSIVGAGRNGTQLHYMRDRDPARPGDLVVMDAATEYEGYAADITRTIPVSGKFSPDQRVIYQLVRDAQAAAERNSKPGMSAPAATDSSVAVRAVGLARLGLIESVDATFDPPWKVNCTATPAACRQSMLWMIHGISHGLGLAVHDPTQFHSGDHTFKEGDAFTIEPGIYISTASLDVLPDTPKNRAFIAHVRAAVERYNNTGVRIEDDYVITASGLERMSSAPREISEIESIMQRRPARK